MKLKSEIKTGLKKGKGDGIMTDLHKIEEFVKKEKKKVAQIPHEIIRHTKQPTEDDLNNHVFEVFMESGYKIKGDTAVDLSRILITAPMAQIILKYGDVELINTIKQNGVDMDSVEESLLGELEYSPSTTHIVTDKLKDMGFSDNFYSEFERYKGMHGALRTDYRVYHKETLEDYKKRGLGRILGKMPEDIREDPYRMMGYLMNHDNRDGHKGAFPEEFPLDFYTHPRLVTLMTVMNLNVLYNHESRKMLEQVIRDFTDEEFVAFSSHYQRLEEGFSLEFINAERQSDLDVDNILDEWPRNIRFVRNWSQNRFEILINYLLVLIFIKGDNYQVTEDLKEYMGNKINEEEIGLGWE